MTDKRARGKGAAKAAPKKPGRKKSIRCRGEMTGMGSPVLPDHVVDVLEAYFDVDDADADHRVIDQLGTIWASYQAAAAASAMRPTASEELADLGAIVEDARALAMRPDLAADPRELIAGETRDRALRLWNRLLNFPPVSRGLAGESGRDLVTFESALQWLIELLPRPALWSGIDMGGALKSLADSCDKIRPPAFTKRHYTARARLIRALGEFHARHESEREDRLFDPAEKTRDRFVRDLLQAFGVAEPDRI